MVHRKKVRALVVSRRNMGEADRFVTFFTREHGFVQAVAKGVRKIPSSRGGHLEPFTKVLALVSESRAGAYVGAVETEEYFYELRNNAMAMQKARTITLVARRLFDQNEAEPELYDAVEHAWRMLPQLSMEKQQVLEGVVIMLAVNRAGFMPDLGACQVCGTSKPQDSVVLLPQEGGFRCLPCHATFHNAEYSLPPHLLRVLRFMVVRPRQALRLAVAEDEGRQLMNTLYHFVSGIIRQPVGVS